MLADTLVIICISVFTAFLGEGTPATLFFCLLRFMSIMQLHFTWNSLYLCLSLWFSTWFKIPFLPSLLALLGSMLQMFDLFIPINIPLDVITCLVPSCSVNIDPSIINLRLSRAYTFTGQNIPCMHPVSQLRLLSKSAICNFLVVFDLFTPLFHCWHSRVRDAVI